MTGERSDGGRLVVGADGYPTIRDAWAAADSGDTVYVHSSYDAREAGEPFPVRLDYRRKEVALVGGHPSGSVVDAGGTDENVIEVYGAGYDDYRNNPLVANLRIVGGRVGLRVAGAPFSSYRNLVFHRTGDHGVVVDEYESDGNAYGTWGATLYNCQAWNCGGDGFRLNSAASPHGTTLYACKATNNDGVGFRLRGTGTKLLGGDAQLNRDWGIEARTWKAILVAGAYVEGNARDRDHPVEAYARGCQGLTVRDCYFHGINPRGADHGHDRVQRAVNVHETERLAVRDNVFRRYGEGALALYDCTDADVYEGSNLALETATWAQPPTAYGNTRTRSHGVVYPQDLSSVDGAFEGDRGYHVGEDREGPAVWRDGRWHVAATTPL